MFSWTFYERETSKVQFHLLMVLVSGVKKRKMERLMLRLCSNFGLFYQMFDFHFRNWALFDANRKQLDTVISCFLRHRLTSLVLI